MPYIITKHENSNDCENKERENTETKPQPENYKIHTSNHEYTKH